MTSAAVLAAVVTLSAWPSHLTLAPGTQAIVTVQAATRDRLQVDARVAGYTLDLHGRPQLAGQAAGRPLLTVSPHRVIVAHAGTTLVVSAPPAPRGARAGDHSAAVLITATAPAAHGIPVRMRVGIAVTVRVPGRVVRRLVIRALHVQRRGRHRLVELTLANRGNVIEAIRGTRLTLVLRRRGRVVARLRAGPQLLLPRTNGIVVVRYDGPTRGRVTAQPVLRGAGAPAIARRFPLRL